ncbi:hypothetical protein EVAR_496_1 [Eumeta japonica]|uniref:Uncharacterized protein n=1 Tax=Eumeta variegata TaxID=151549 RepID=A0A4C1SAR1_EUMVA|nr:hypothetical protein EVAR_496_1 [Eumeta japonica]
MFIDIKEWLVTSHVHSILGVLNRVGDPSKSRPPDIKTGDSHDGGLVSRCPQAPGPPGNGARSATARTR